MPTIIVVALLALLLVGLVAWVFRELQLTLGWLTQGAGTPMAPLDAQDVLQAHRELQSR